MSRARTLAGAIGSDGALNVADVAGLAAVASSGSASDLTTGTLPNARLASGAAVANLGYTPVNKAGDTISGTLRADSFLAPAFYNDTETTKHGSYLGRDRAVLLYFSQQTTNGGWYGSSSGTAWVNFQLNTESEFLVCDAVVNPNSDGSGAYRASARVYIGCSVSWNGSDYTPHLSVKPSTEYALGTNTVSITPVIFNTNNSQEYTQTIPYPAGSNSNNTSWWHQSAIRLRIKVSGYNQNANNGPGQIAVFLRRVAYA